MRDASPDSGSSDAFLSDANASADVPASDGGDVADAGTPDVAADVALDGADAGLADCFEIFPTFEPDDGGADASVFSPNPLNVDLGSVKVSSVAKLKLRYYNACGEQSAYVTGTYFASTDAGTSGSFAIASAPSNGLHVLGATQAEIVVTFSPTTSGPHHARLIFLTTRGYYQTEIEGVGVP